MLSVAFTDMQSKSTDTVIIKYHCIHTNDRRIVLINAPSRNRTGFGGLCTCVPNSGSGLILRQGSLGYGKCKFTCVCVSSLV